MWQSKDLMPQFPHLYHEDAGSIKIVESTTVPTTERLYKGGFFCWFLALGDERRGLGTADGRRGTQGLLIPRDWR